MVVVPYQPWRRALTGLGFLLVLMATGAGFYLYGYSEGVFVNGDARAERDRLILQVDDMEEQLEVLQQDLINSQQASTVDRQALEEVQGTIISLREKISQLQEDVLFYKQIMSPENTETGLISVNWTWKARKSQAVFATGLSCGRSATTIISSVVTPTCTSWEYRTDRKFPCHCAAWPQKSTSSISS